MKKVFAVILSALMLLSCASAMAEGAFRVGMECNYAPYNWTQAEPSEFTVPIEGGGGYADGYDVQIAKLIAEGLGKEITVERLAEIFLDLQAQGAHNINLVTPGQWRPWIIAALDLARAQGLHLPIVCNTGGYETVESVHAWRGFIDIWLADLKYVSPALSAELSAAPDYFAQARPAIEAMMAQAGHPVFDSEGILQRGVILRHLALPGHVDDSFAVLDQMAAWNKADPGCFLPSVMSQYTPFYQAADHGIGRRITTYEYRRVVNYAMDLGLSSGYMQQKSSAKEEYTPSFDLTGV